MLCYYLFSGFCFVLCLLVLKLCLTMLSGYSFILHFPPSLSLSLSLSLSPSLSLSLYIYMYIKEFMKPLEQPGQRGGAVLDQKEIQSIFGSIPDILNVHVKIMVRTSVLCIVYSVEVCV